MSEGHPPHATRGASPSKRRPRPGVAHLIMLGCACWTCWIWSGCTTTLRERGEAQKGPLEFVSAMTRAQRGVSRGLADGDAAQQALAYQRAVAYRARINPAPCGCPALEIFIAGRWERTFVIDSETGEVTEPPRTPPEAGDAVFSVKALLVEQRINADNKLSYRAVVIGSPQAP